MQITPNEVESILGFTLDPKIKEYFSKYNLKFNKLNDKEFEKYLIDVIDILTTDITKSGEHRLSEWESGWGENLKNYLTSKDEYDLIPKYHSKRNYVRWKQNIINPEDKKFDYYIHTIFVDSIINYYLNSSSNILEFGCGPGYHLLRLQNILPNKQFWGADWTTASQNIISKINENTNNNIGKVNFNFFSPNYSFDFPKDCGVYTIAALEQVGENFKLFLDYLLDKKPNLCVHLEPIDELLDPTNLVDNLSIKYFRKRNYLKGFLPYLENLEKENKIKIVKKQRIFSGSYFIEGHSLIVWKPL